MCFWQEICGKPLIYHTGLVLSCFFSFILSHFFPHCSAIRESLEGEYYQPPPTQTDTHSSSPLLFFLPFSPIVSSALEHAWIINLPSRGRVLTNRDSLYCSLKSPVLSPAMFSPLTSALDTSGRVSSLTLIQCSGLARHWRSQAVLTWFNFDSPLCPLSREFVAKFKESWKSQTGHIF